MEVSAPQGPQQAGRLLFNALSSVRPVDVHVQSVHPTASAFSYDATAVGRWSLVMKNNTGGGRGCFGRRPTWDRKQRWMGEECDENPTVNSTPPGLKYSAGHNHDDDLDSVVLVGVVGVSNASIKSWSVVTGQK